MAGLKPTRYTLNPCKRTEYEKVASHKEAVSYIVPHGDNYTVRVERKGKLVAHMVVHWRTGKVEYSIGGKK